MRKYDLEERTLKFAKNCIDLCKTLPKDSINFELVNQVIRSAGSIGANYREASNTDTRKDFFHRIGICRRESKETKYWLDLIMHSNPILSSTIIQLINEAQQLTLIFSSIFCRYNHKT
ncbi:MAG: four helix bundle protein [Candidatus Omnitrophota bacterium]